MALQDTNPTKTLAWQKLQNHFEAMKNASMVTMFKENSSRAAEFQIKWNDFLLIIQKYHQPRNSEHTIRLS